MRSGRETTSFGPGSAPVPGRDMDGKDHGRGLGHDEETPKTPTERLGTSYAREMTLVKELAETKTQLATAGRERRSGAGAAPVRGQDQYPAQRPRGDPWFRSARPWAGKTATSNYIVETIENGIPGRSGPDPVPRRHAHGLGRKERDRENMVDTVDEMRRDMASRSRARSGTRSRPRARSLTSDRDPDQGPGPGPGRDRAARVRAH